MQLRRIADQLICSEAAHVRSGIVMQTQRRLGNFLLPVHMLPVLVSCTSIGLTHITNRRRSNATPCIK